MALSDSSAAARDIKRMEAFSDAVFAIALTLPIVEVTVPTVGHGHDLRQQLAHEWPSFAAYGLSILIIGIYWTHHHFTGKLRARIGHYGNLLNLLLLAAVCFVPFPTRVFCDAIRSGTQVQTAGAFLAVALAAPCAAWLIKWLYGVRMGSLDDRLEPGYVAQLTRTYAVSAGVQVAGGLIGLVDWRIGLPLAAGATLYFLKPPPAPRYKPGQEPPPPPREVQDK
jgi:uncharacterized membrane protein